MGCVYFAKSILFQSKTIIMFLISLNVHFKISCYVLRFLKFESLASNVLTDKQTWSVHDTIYAKAASAKSFKAKATSLIGLLNKDIAANRVKCIKYQTSANLIPPIRLKA